MTSDWTPEMHETARAMRRIGKSFQEVHAAIRPAHREMHVSEVVTVCERLGYAVDKAAWREWRDAERAAGRDA